MLLSHETILCIDRSGEDTHHSFEPLTFTFRATALRQIRTPHIALISTLECLGQCAEYYRDNPHQWSWRRFSDTAHLEI